MCILCTYIYVMKEERLIIRIDAKEKAKLKKVAKENGRSMSNYLLYLIEMDLKQKVK